MRTAAFRTRVAVVMYGYFVVIAVFAIFLAFQELPQELYGIHLEKLNVAERFVVVSVIVVAPVILGLLWDRLKSLKIGEIELILDQASSTLNIELASAIQNSQSSETPDLVNLIASAIAQADLKLVEVNLRCRDYWWTTRLFLLAALTQEYTNVERLVFVKHGTHPAKRLAREVTRCCHHLLFAARISSTILFAPYTLDNISKMQALSTATVLSSILYT